MIALWKSWSLRRQLVIGVSVLVAIVLATVGTMSVLTLRSSVLGLINTQLTGAADGFGKTVTKYRSTPLPTGELPPAGAMKPLTQVMGQAPGNVVALIRDGAVVDSAFWVDGGARPLPTAALDTVVDVSSFAAEPTTVELPELGWFQMVSRPGDGGEILVTGVPHTPAWEAMMRVTTIVSATTALALVVTALSTVVIVGLALRPLRRVASTAAEVAALPLDRDNHTTRCGYRPTTPIPAPRSVWSGTPSTACSTTSNTPWPTSPRPTAACASSSPTPAMSSARPWPQSTDTPS